ncbi:nuclear transport factor 2 family protein [Kribbella sp. NBC_00889]|uniref:nuclear transport factor 2 family protein n=1 Tax=Kribbella sp. NBC_00889 TaxID=2975974 RepID=UPI00386EDCE4|nr:nuclear transport factor 2 family protein [Kribbella sp. NBC_00889]
MEADKLRRIERDRLTWLVDRRVAEADAVHADDFVIVTPSGLSWTKAEYLGGIESGEIDYRRFEPISEIDVMLDGDVAVLRYRSAIEISVGGREPGDLEAWHLDCYRRSRPAGSSAGRRPPRSHKGALAPTSTASRRAPIRDKPPTSAADDHRSPSAGGCADA